jgi:hypothetical protein
MHTSIQIVFVICNNAASDQRINLFDRIQNARYEQHFPDIGAGEGHVEILRYFSLTAQHRNFGYRLQTRY